MYAVLSSTPASRPHRYTESATMRECPRTVVFGTRGVLAQRCWKRSCPTRSRKSNAPPAARTSLTPARCMYCPICSEISLRVRSIPYKDRLDS